MKRVLQLAAAALFATSTAGAQTLLLDTFDTELGGGPGQTNYASFANWNVTGAVDLIRDGEFGLRCFGNTGSCVDLDGSQGLAGSLVSKTAFSFNAGDLVGISFMASGSQRTTASDFLQFTLNFSTATTFSSYAASLGGTLLSGGNTVVGSGFGTGTNVAGNSAWALWTLQFVAANSGSFTLEIGTTSADNVGPMLDDVIIGVAPANTNVVPEPSTWTLMIGGLGMLAVAARKRRAA